ncbi:hypothetical protein [Leucobacter triazinivorans]|uniref:hypothetical protein n=1 Tax=Leucobacter triazinivorans TaxID=1784719 RepID=UPI0013EE9B23|nr:hypothetical protein [Leucobacter triazinivorans]
MTTHTSLEDELERRLSEIESVEASDPAHAALSGRSLAAFLSVVVGIALVAWLGVLL